MIIEIELTEEQIEDFRRLGDSGHGYNSSRCMNARDELLKVFMTAFHAEDEVECDACEALVPFKDLYEDEMDSDKKICIDCTCELYH